MKEQILQKIRTTGKVGSVLTLIAQILLYAGVVCILAVTIFLAVLPRDFMTMQVEGSGKIYLHVPKLVEKLKITDLEKLETEERRHRLDLNGFELDMVNFTRTETGLVIDASGRLVDFTSKNLLYFMAAALVYLAMAVVTMHFVRKLCKAFQGCSSPFDPEVIRALTRVAYAMIPWTLFSSLSEGCTNGILTGKFSLNLGINLNMVFVILLIFILVQIFKYGAALQQESDETL